jgi:DNA-binding IclR family transcriptional regulator
VTTGRSKTVQSVDRALGLLRAIAEADGPRSLGELAQRCELERPTAWRLLLTLEANGLIEKVEPSRYRISAGWIGLAQLHAVDSLVRLARPVLADLASAHRVTASLAHARALGLRYVDQVDGPLFVSPKWEGELSPYASSPGKAVLAALPEAEWRAVVGSTLEPLTETTITDLGALEDELAVTRRRGYAVCRGEDVTYSNGASAVIRLFGRPIAAVDLWGPDRRVSTDRLDHLGAAALAGAARVEAALVARSA